MRISSELLLTFLLNACWQVALIAALAAAGSWLLRNSVVRYQHWLWVSALCLAFLVPAITSSRVLFETVAQSTPTVDSSFARDRIPSSSYEARQDVSSTALTFSASTLQLNPTLGWGLLALYCAFLIYRAFKLAQAWVTTRSIRRSAIELEPDERVAAVVRTCERELGERSREVRVMRSETLPVPVTIGLFHPVIILPEPLLREGNSDLLTSAIGHEFIHVARCDYLLNFIYELLFVPISFHPAAALLRRRVKQTRELCCDELVAERILNAEVYARSLVRLASSAPPLRRLSVTTTVGIADADILEARIMSLLKKPELKTRWKKLLLVAVTLLLLIPSLAAAAFAMRFEVEQNAQERTVQEPERKEKEKLEMRMREGSTVDAMKERMANDPEFRKEMHRKQEMEIEMKAIAQAAMVRLAKINMDQAIQVASSQQPGKVLLCSLGAKGWEEPGKLGKDGVVFYHVIIADEVNAGSTHVWVNALDGTIMKTEKELPRKMRSPEGNN
jgi:beta-lactamase regulating signal transducer with metallopeptidase domain